MLRREEQYKHQIKEIKVMIKKIGIIGAMEEEVGGTSWKADLCEDDQSCVYGFLCRKDGQ